MNENTNVLKKSKMRKDHNRRDNIWCQTLFD